MELPHFERATRRVFLRQGLSAAGLVAAGALLAACSKSDSEIFASVATTSPSSTPATGGTSAPTVAPTVTKTPTSSAAAGTANAATIAFSYTASDTNGRSRNPYIASWIEDDKSAMVALVSVWYLAREAKYLRELPSFAAFEGDIAQDQLDAVSGATRSAGKYQLQWDGKGLDGSALAGTYTLWIEAAREHGPHSVMNGKLVLGRAGSTTITGSGELSDAVVTVA
jgi:hypothetical protein